MLFLTENASDDAVKYVRTLNEGMAGVPHDDGDNPVYVIGNNKVI